MDWGQSIPIRTTAPLVPVAFRIVFIVPAPRSVQLLGTVSVPLMLYFPEASNTTSPLGQDASAAFNCASVALAPAAVAVAQAEVAQIAVRLGMPPGTPAVVQSMARAEFRIPDHACAWDMVGTIRSKMMDKKINCLRFIVL